MPGDGRPLLKLPHALCTPHIGYVEKDNDERYFGIAFANINRFAGGSLAEVANPAVLLQSGMVTPVPSLPPRP